MCGFLEDNDILQSKTKKLNLWKSTSIHIRNKFASIVDEW